MKNNILIVDDIPKNIQVIAGHLGDVKYELTMATSGEAALKAIKNEPPDLILLDVNMPGIDGFEVCSILKESIETRDIPVMFLTARVEIEDLVRGFEVGAVDFLTKPFNKSELQARVKTHLELYNLKQELIKKYEQLAKFALTDPLTGLLNRRAVLNFLEAEGGRINRGGKSSVIILCDIDDFKAINDTYGHDAGDFVLTNVSNIMRQSVRINDNAARWGGEEFLIVLSEINMKDGMIVAEKIRSSIDSFLFSFNNIEMHITITAGMTIYNAQKPVENSIAIADKALYKGKNEGKNRII